MIEIRSYKTQVYIDATKISSIIIEKIELKEDFHQLTIVTDKLIIKSFLLSTEVLSSLDKIRQNRFETSEYFYIIAVENIVISNSI